MRSSLPVNSFPGDSRRAHEGERQELNVEAQQVLLAFMIADRKDTAMRAVTITKPGGPEVLAVTDRPVRAAGPGEVRIAVKAAAVNPTDVLMRQNELYSKGTPGIPGMDGAGVVESVGEGVERLKVGDEVMAVV